MTTTEQNETEQTDAVEEFEQVKMSDEQAIEYAKRAGFGKSHGMIDAGMGSMGGAGASGTGPDIADQSTPMPGNHSDLPADQR